MAAIFQITDGTTTIDLIKGRNQYGFHLESWRPQIVGYKGGGTWQESALSTGRQIVDKQFENYIDTFNLKANQVSQDTLIYELQEIRRLLEKASSYWTTDWVSTPVYFVAKASNETNTRYALIYTGRIPEDEQPYNQPFLQPLCASVMDNLTLVVEHGPWLATAPGTGTCVQTGVVQTWASPYHLEFNGSSSRVQIPDAAALQTLHAANLTAEAWVYTDGWGEGGAGKIFWKRDAVGVGGWFFGIDSTHGLVVDGQFPVPSISRSGTDDFSPTSTWVHVAATHVLATGAWRLWVGGTEVSYTLQQVSIGGAISDAGDDLFIGNDINLASTFDGKIGWARLSNNLRYTANFTPPERCDLPGIDGNTIGQWIGAEKSGATIADQDSAAGNDGTQTDCTFNVDCSNTYGNTDGDTCEDTVYIANKHNVANITHVFVDDGGAFGGNLQGAALPYNLLPAVPAVNDAVYFGINTLLLDSGPFWSVIFDIGTAQTDITDIRWEYYQGAPTSAWSALTVVDRTDTTVAFDTTGVNGVHFEPPTDAVNGDWSTVAVNGVTGYWIRARVNAIGAAPTAPTQQNRQIYSVVWPYIDIDSTEVLGDIAALSKIKIHNQTDKSPVAAWHTNRVIVGLRSLSRGSSFTAYLNASDEQNISGVTVTLGGNTAYATDPSTPTGRRATYNPAGVSAQSAEVTIRLDNTISTHFYGRFHAFIRASQVGGFAGEIGVALRLDGGDGTSTVTIFQTNEVFFQNTTEEYALLDIGAIVVPSSIVNLGEIWSALDFIVLLSNSSGVPGDAYIYDLILIPTDEWSGDFPGDFNVTNAYSLIVDSIERPKNPVRANVYVESTGYLAATYPAKSPGSSILQSNSAQRLWFLSTYTTTTDGPATPVLSHTLQLFKQQRYLSMRGRR